MKVLIVDDDLALADVIAFTLSRVGFQTVLAHDGLTALDCWRAESPDLIILDLNLPRLDGLAVCRQIRAHDNTPIIMLTVRNEDDDIVNGLRLGADDYITKPFSPRQVVARIEAVMRRAGLPPVSPSPLAVDDLSLDMSRLELHQGDKVISLTQLECRLLEVLMRNNGQVIPADRLIEHIWGVDGGDRTMLKQLVYRLRRKMKADSSQPDYLETINGVGYTFDVRKKA
jgi:DNA-binding response OmpR family regulator